MNAHKFIYDANFVKESMCCLWHTTENEQEFLSECPLYYDMRAKILPEYQKCVNWRFAMERCLSKSEPQFDSFYTMLLSDASLYRSDNFEVCMH